MKFMKLGTRADTFYTEEATRTVISEILSDLTIQINNVNYLLHKYPILPKSGLLQRLCSDSEGSNRVTLELHDIPGGEDAFELCAKFCYGIAINVSAHNFVSAICAAKFLQMTECVEKGNFVLKLEAFFSSCILEGWKDSLVTLQSTKRLFEWSENLGIIRRCIDSIVEKILTPASKVTWSYTYTRPGYVQKYHQIVPKDWWTEDISDLDIDLFRCVVAAVRSTYMLPPQLIGEALHVYACHWLPDTTKTQPRSSASQNEELLEKNRQVLETIVNMIPPDRGSVSIGFLLRLLSIANFLAVSPVAKSELVRRSSLQLEEATVNDLLLPSNSASDAHFYDIDLVRAVVESFIMQWRKPHGEHSQSLRPLRKVTKLVDSYLQVVAKDVNMPVLKVSSLAEALPDFARPEHDDLYKAINIYLKEHPDMPKADKKRLCRVLDCQKLSAQVCAHVVKNERLPLRTVVQVLFFEQERNGRATSHKHSQILSRQQTPTTADELSKLKLDPDEQSSNAMARRAATPGSVGRMAAEQNVSRKAVSEIEEEEMEIREEGSSGRKVEHRGVIQRRSKLSHNKGTAK